MSHQRGIDMTNAPSTDTSNKSLTRDLLHAAQYYLGGRRTLLLFAAVAIVGGVALNWNWLVAAGLAPILIVILPCAVMCGLSLCMHKMSDGSGGCCATDSSQPHQAELRSGNAKSQLSHPTAIQGALGCCHETDNSIAPASAEKSQPTQKKGDPKV